MNIIDQLIYFYWNFEPWNHTRLLGHELKDYFETLIQKRRIITAVTAKDRLMGYIEYWNVNQAQLERIMAEDRFNIALEDIETGSIAYVANIVIDPIFRATVVMKELSKEFFDRNPGAELISGERLKRNNKPFRIYGNIRRGVNQIG